MSRFGRVGVLYGGVSAEREVSLMSGAGVHAALRAQGVDAHLFDTAHQTVSELARAGFDRVFIALHGRYGEDGTLQGVLELLRIPYTGSGPKACSLAMDKTTTKRVWLQHGLPTPDFVELSCDEPPEDLAGRLGLPLVVKPAHEGSTLGLTRVQTVDQILPAQQLACRYDDRILAERFIRGRELTVSILGTGRSARALPITEIIAPDGHYDYEHKYISDDTVYETPARLPAVLSAHIQDLAVRAYQALDGEGWGRIDVMLDEQDQPWLLELNTSPGMTGHSLVPMGAHAAGMSYAELCLEILSTARCKLQRARVS